MSSKTQNTNSDDFPRRKGSALDYHESKSWTTHWTIMDTNPGQPTFLQKPSFTFWKQIYLKTGFTQEMKSKKKQVHIQIVTRVSRHTFESSWFTGPTCGLLARKPDSFSETPPCSRDFFLFPVYLHEWGGPVGDMEAGVITKYGGLSEGCMLVGNASKTHISPSERSQKEASALNCCGLLITEI